MYTALWCVSISLNPILRKIVFKINANLKNCCLSNNGTILWLWRGRIGKYGPISWEIGGPIRTDGRRPEGRIGLQFWRMRSVFTDASEPESQYSHCDILKMVFSELHTTLAKIGPYFSIRTYFPIEIRLYRKVGRYWKIRTYFPIEWFNRKIVHIFQYRPIFQ